MQSTIYSRISRADLKQIFGIGEIVLGRWIDAGLPCEPDGRFSLTKVCRWTHKHHQVQERQKVTLSNISQRDLITLTGKSRQTVFNWTNAGMPRNRDRSYNLAAVIRWLPGFYDQVYKARHQRIARRISDLIKEIKFRKG